LLEQVTLTTPEGRQAEREGYPLPTAELVAQFRGVAYSARGALTTPANYQRTKRYVKTAFQKQLGNVGLSFVEILSACPTDWHLTPVESLKWIEEKLIAEFPLGEFKNVDRID
jgi:2-oxoglutarate ferredoxin oxidoreductase subunit beta